MAKRGHELTGNRDFPYICKRNPLLPSRKNSLLKRLDERNFHLTPDTEASSSSSRFSLLVRNWSINCLPALTAGFGFLQSLQPSQPAAWPHLSFYNWQMSSPQLELHHLIRQRESGPEVGEISTRASLSLGKLLPLGLHRAEISTWNDTMLLFSCHPPDSICSPVQELFSFFSEAQKLCFSIRGGWNKPALFPVPVPANSYIYFLETWSVTLNLSRSLPWFLS